jgi:DNA-directed RNA polymerase specialized sigma24 family protein
MTLEDLKQIPDLKKEIAVHMLRLQRNPEFQNNAAAHQRLTGKIDELNNLVSNAEKFIENIPNPRVRMILVLRYIDGLSWHETAKEIYKKETGDNLRLFVKRWFTKHNDN